MIKLEIKKEHIILFFIFLLGAFIRIFLLRFGTFSGNDAPTLISLGINLINNGQYIFGQNHNWGLFFPPGYPLSIGVVNLFFDDPYFTGKLISLFSGLTTIFLFYFTGKELHSKESGLFAAFAYAIHPHIFKTSTIVATEALFFCLLFLSIYLFMVSIRIKKVYIYFLLGMSIGMSYLTRPEGIFLLLLPFLSFNSYNPFKNRQNLLKISTVIITFILIISPYLLFIKSSTGKMSLSGKSSYLALLLEKGITKSGVTYDKTVYSIDEDDKDKLQGFNSNKHFSIAGFITREPFTFIRGHIRNSKKAIVITLKLLIPVMVPLFLSFFSLGLLKDKKKRVILLYSLLFFMIYPCFFILVRHMYSTVLLLILFSSIGFAQSRSAIFRMLDYYDFRKNFILSFIANNIKYLIVIISILSSSLFIYKTTDLSHRGEIPSEHIKAGYYLNNNMLSAADNRLNIMQRVPWLSFYSGNKFTMLPYASPDDVIGFAKHYSVDLIVIDERSLAGWEFYEELMNLDKYSNNIELVYEDNLVNLIKLFEINR